MPSLPPEWSAIPKDAADLLLRAYTYAQVSLRPASDFAVEIHRLRNAGIDECQLRLSLCAHDIDHYCEGTAPNQSGTVLLPLETLRFTPASCFALTEKGAEHVRQVLNGTLGTATNVVVGTTRGLGTKKSVPRWNAESRKLSVGKKTVKHFRLPAPAQQQALTAFEQAGWPERIDDPLASEIQGDRKKRLRGLIESLNRNQQTPLIHFQGDGQGTGICWQFIDKRPKRRK